jgi:hypothetical protein
MKRGGKSKFENRNSKFEGRRGEDRIYRMNRMGGGEGGRGKGSG